MKSDTPQESEALRAVPTPGVARADAAQMVRVEAANFQRSLPLSEHPDNGDEARYPSRFASYSKGLPHDNLGDVNTVEYDKLGPLRPYGDAAQGWAGARGGRLEQRRLWLRGGVRPGEPDVVHPVGV